MKRWSFWLRAIITVVAIALLITWIDWREFLETVQRADGLWLLSVFLLIHADRMFMAFKWRLLLKGIGLPITLGQAIKVYYVGAFWSSFLPSSVGGDVIRVTTYMQKSPGSGSTLTSSIVIERVLGMLALAIVALVSCGLLLNQQDTAVSSLLGVIILLLVGSLIMVLLLFNTSVHRFFQKLLSLLPANPLTRLFDKLSSVTLAFKEKPGVLLVFLMLSVMEQVFPILANFALAHAFAIDLSLSWVIIGVPLTLVVVRMPISIDGLGVKEITYAFIFGLAGLTSSQAVTMALADRVLLLLSTIPGAWWTLEHTRREAPQMVPVGTTGANDKA